MEHTRDAVLAAYLKADGLEGKTVNIEEVRQSARFLGFSAAAECSGREHITPPEGIDTPAYVMGWSLYNRTHKNGSYTGHLRYRRKKVHSIV